MNNNFLRSHRTLITSSFLAFIVGATGASVYWYIRANAELAAVSAAVKPIRQANNTYQFIDPLLGYNVPDDVKEFNDYQPLAAQVNAAVTEESSSSLDSFGVYFRDLTLGRWMGINEDSGFAPGSMMKVAIMIAYFKEAEQDSSVLQKYLTYSSSTADELNGIPFETPSNLQIGQSYTVEQLIEAMIISSDNGAKNALLNNIDQSSLSEIYTDLGLPYVNPEGNYDDYMISPKQYAVLLRVLYNATYLSRDYSEKALSIMGQAEYSGGIVAGVPSGTSVAQKFGESVVNTNAQVPEITLSNCGIVYYPGHPYILCVMTKGKDLGVLTQTIATISKTVWTGVNAYAIDQTY